MITKPKFLVTILLLACVPGFAATVQDNSSPLGVSMRPEKGELAISYKGRPLLLYAFGKDQFKPYVRELYTLEGDNVLRDAPPDHLHHHGLMYAIRVNGINFWEETGEPGYEIPVGLPHVEQVMQKNGSPTVAFTQLIHWVAKTNRSLADTAPVALLTENRTLTLTVNESGREVALAWRGDFQVGQGAEKVTLAGANYHGLGLRLPESFNRVAMHRNSEDAPYTTGGTGDVIPARWSAVSHTVNGREITVALFGQPASDGGLPRFFTMVQPFTYLAVTEGLDKAPMERLAGEKFGIRYLLVAYPDTVSRAALEERYREWKP